MAGQHPNFALLVWPQSEAGSDITVWKRPVWSRLLRQLNNAGIERVFATGGRPGGGGPEGRSPSESLISAGGWQAARRKLRSGQSALIVGADWVLDDGLFCQLDRLPPGSVLTQQGRFAGLAVIDKDLFASLESEELEVSLGTLLAGGRLVEVSLESLSEYRPGLRRRHPLFACRVRDEESRGQAEQKVLDAAQKGTNDLPAQFVHPPLENALVRLLVPLGLTANSVTALSIATAFAAAGLFYSGRLGLAILLALAVGVLDGTDGKIARVTLKTSRFGDFFDHFFDYVYEALWYLALGRYLAGAGGCPACGTVSLILCTAYYLDRAVLGFWKLFRDYDFHEASRWDRQFRRVCGRRNNVVFLLAFCILMGHAGAGLYLSAGWYVLTFVVHSVRIGWLLSRGSAVRPERGSL